MKIRVNKILHHCKRNAIAPLCFALMGAVLSGCSETDPSESSDPFSIVQGSWTSQCFETTNWGVLHTVTYTNFDFTISFSLYQDRSCQGRVSRAGSNLMTGRFLTGDAFTTEEGLTAVEVDYFYETGFENREYFDPTPYEIAYLDPTTGQIYLGIKSGRQNGFSASARPSGIDFNNGWTRN